jgi:hypothetical protein
MITIDEFKLSNDLATISVKVSSDGVIANARIYIGDNYLTGQYYDIVLTGGNTLDVIIPAATLGVTAPLTDIYILYTDNVFNESIEDGIWSLEAPSQ